MTVNSNHKEIFLDISRDFMNQSTSDDGAGFNQFNFLTAGGIPVATTNNDLNNQNGITLFQSDFPAGLDTLNKFHLVYNGAANLPGKVNDSATGGNGSVEAVNFDLGFLETFIDYNGTADTNQWVIQSQTSMKLRNSEYSYETITGRFRNANSTGVLDLRITSRKDIFGDNAIAQASWNINTMDGPASDSNPSGVTLDVDKINTLIILIPLKDSGNVKFGFFIGNKVIYAHEFKNKNTTSSLSGLVNKPIRLEGNLVSTDQSNLKIGLFDHTSGHFFEVRSTGNTGPQFSTQFYSAGCFAVGARRDSYYRPFSKGNETNLVTVGAVRIPIASLKPKLLFPPAAPITDNKTTVSLQEIKVSGKSVNLDDGVFIEIIFNQGPTLLTGATFSLTDVDSGVDVDTAATAISAGGKQIYAAPIFPNRGNSSLSVKPEELFSNFINQYACSHIIANGGIDVAIDPTISVVATSFLTNTADVDLTATFIWAENP